MRSLRLLTTAAIVAAAYMVSLQSAVAQPTPAPTAPTAATPAPGASAAASCVTGRQKWDPVQSKCVDLRSTAKSASKVKNVAARATASSKRVAAKAAAASKRAAVKAKAATRKAAAKAKRSARLATAKVRSATAGVRQRVKSAVKSRAPNATAKSPTAPVAPGVSPPQAKKI